VFPAAVSLEADGRRGFLLRTTGNGSNAVALLVSRWRRHNAHFYPALPACNSNFAARAINEKRKFDSSTVVFRFPSTLVVQHEVLPVRHDASPNPNPTKSIH